MNAIKNLIKNIVFLFLSREKKEVIETLQAYADAFMTFDPGNAIGYFETPMLYLSDDSVKVFESSKEILAYVGEVMNDLKANKYAKDVLSKFHIKSLTPTVAVTSFNLVRIDSDGDAFAHMGAMYTWRKTQGSWKVAIGVLLSHPH